MVAEQLQKDTASLITLTVVVIDTSADYVQQGNGK